MIELMNAMPFWALAATVFVLRMCDVSLGTLRVISVVHGRMGLSVVLGFFEVLIWLAAVSQVIVGIFQQPFLMVAYAGGFAAGNAVGIALERRLAMGSAVVLMISRDQGGDIAAALRAVGQVVTTFEGRGRDAPRLLLYATAARRDVPRIVEAARQVDPSVFYTIEPCSETTHVSQLPSSAGWRAFLKRK